ncbi:hypothetical protein ABPG75_010930 [Micractinium tetrahymenae]
MDVAERDPNQRDTLLEERQADLEAARLTMTDPNFYWPSGKTRAYILRLIPKCKMTRAEFDVMSKEEVQAMIEEGKAAAKRERKISQYQVMQLRMKGYKGPTPVNQGEYNSILAGLADARELGPEFWAEHCPSGFDVVLSDMCHFTLGNSVADAYKSLELARTAWTIAAGGELAGEQADPNLPWGGPGRGVLKPGGSLVMKLLQGSGTQEFAAELRRDFAKVAWHRPKATRSESKEVFLLGLKRK